MRLYTLNKYTTNPAEPLSYTLGTFLEGYSSLIWTERFNTPGEFELITTYLTEYKDILPGVLLSLSDTYEVMLVESRNIRRNPEGYDELVIAGRSVAFIIDERIIWAPSSGPLLMPRIYSSLGMGLVLLWNTLVNAGAADAVYTTDRPIALYQDSPIPGVVITDSSGGGTPEDAKFSVSIGQAGPMIREYLDQDKAGLRIIRPSDQPDTQIVTVNTTNGASKGQVTRTFGSADDKLRFDVYRGVNRSQNQAVNTPVIFSFDAGHLVQGEIIDSDADFITTQIMTSPPSYMNASKTTYSHPGAGFSIKIRHIDAKSILDGLDSADIPNVVRQFRAKYWAAHTGRAYADGEAGSGSPYQYKRDYGLGDTVTLRVGEVTQDVFISEHTRAEDLSGDRGYPTFETIPSEVTRGLHRL